ncbi:hypothetical protein DUE52_29190 [Larkinella punicea]|uniref:Uncharacterized protein n=1 Tax=Larkinella punicea TaxID=2315727 RepID=A0A368JE20_9BACT|nr:hypothetical protein DUE52_29190 [Larkinella punicea]
MVDNSKEGMAHLTLEEKVSPIVRLFESVSVTRIATLKRNTFFIPLHRFYGKTSNDTKPYRNGIAAPDLCDFCMCKSDNYAPKTDQEQKLWRA